MGLNPHSLHTNFMREATLHAAKYGPPIEVQAARKCPKLGDTENWDCERYGAVLNFRTCQGTRTVVVGQGRKFACEQPETNLRIAASNRLNGIELKEAIEFLEGMGIECPQ